MKNIIFYTSPNSIGCQMAKQVLESIAAKTGFNIISIDTSTDKGRNIAHSQNVHELPSVIIQDEDREIGRLNGLITASDLSRIFNLGQNIGSLPVPSINTKTLLLAALAGVVVVGYQQHRKKRSKKRKDEEDFE